MTAFPPEAKTDVTRTLGAGVIARRDDPAKLLMPKSRYRRPSLSLPGGAKFEWPTGTEGIRISGAATIAQHRYFDDNKLVIQVTHRDERRIVMTGQFSGKTGAKNFRQLLDIVTALQPKTGKILSVPGVFMRSQKVAVADYEFEHPQDDKTDSFNYTITFIYLGVGDKIAGVKTVTPKTSLNPKGTTGKARGTTPRVFRVHTGARTLRAVAKIVYGDPNRWRLLWQKNGKVLSALGTQEKLQTKILPLGLSLKY